MCVIQGTTSSKHNGLTYQHKKKQKRQNTVYFPTVKKKERYQNKWYLTYEKLSLQKN